MEFSLAFSIASEVGQTSPKDNYYNPEKNMQNRVEEFPFLKISSVSLITTLIFGLLYLCENNPGSY